MLVINGKRISSMMINGKMISTKYLDGDLIWQLNNALSAWFRSDGYFRSEAW